MFNTCLSRLKCYRNFAKKSFVFLLILSLLLSQFSFLTPSVYAASSPWSQTDWSGGSGQTAWSDTTKFDSSSSVTTSTAGQATLTATSSWYNTSWAYRRKITFDNSSQAENLTNFPVLVKLSSSNINYSNTQDSGQDIRFTDSDGTTLLKHEIEKWDETGNSFVWVKVPQIDASSSTDYIYEYYGNSSASDGQDAANVWGNTARYHLKETTVNDGTEITDSTSNTNILTSVAGATAATGQLDGALTFNGSTQYLKQKIYEDQTGATFGPTVHGLSLAAGQGFYRSQGVDLSGFHGTDSSSTPYMLVLTDSASKIAWGYIGSTDAAEALGSELLSNTGFETFTGGVDDGTSDTINSWPSNYNDSLGNKVEITATANSGSYAVKLTKTTASAYLSQVASVTAGKLYKISFYTRGDGTNSSQVRFENATTSTFITSTIDTSVTGTTYTQKSYYITAPSDCSSLRTYLITSSAAGVVYFDDASVKEVTDIGTDGVHIVSAKNGSTRNWAGIESGFNYNGSTYTFEVRKTDFQITGNLTVGAWVKATDSTNFIIFDKLSGNYGYRLNLDSSDYVNFTIGDGTDTQSATGNSAVSQSTWHHVIGTFDGTNIKVYLDGSLVTTQAQSNPSDLSSTLRSGYDGTNYANGTIDEAFVTTSALSANWIAASFKSESDTFNTYASEEPQITTSGTLTSSIFDTEYSAGAAWGTLTYTATIPSNTSVSVKLRTSNSSSMTGATDFSSCTAITSGSDVSSNSCVTDSQRYIQYQLSLANTDSVSTPTFQDVSITFAAYDADAPSISLTALSTDPNSDNTPTLSGTATESIGTVSNVQFQMDSTSGSWSTCSSDDASFDEATETFTCTPSALSDGSHTMYVRATDSNSNTTTSGSESSDAFTIDATVPTSIDLDSPGDNSYTSSERPTFKWKATSDATAGLWKYTLEIDNPSLGSGQVNGDFTIDSIPTSRTTDYETNKYYIHYENFSDSDSNNNYISVYTKSSTEWSTDSSSGQNDGKLREGKVSWKVKAVDNAGNETNSSRILFIDRTSPSIAVTQVNDLPSTSGESSSATPEVSFALSTTDKTPTTYGKVTDSLSGGDSSQTQDENGPKIASGPKQVEIKVEKKEGLTYKLHTLYTINLDKPYYTCDNKELSDNSKQKCDKYLPFEYTPGQELDLGTYKITVTGKDKADNGSTSSSQVLLTITTLDQIIMPEEKELIEEELKELPKEDQEKVKEELEITKPTEAEKPAILEIVGLKVVNTLANLWWSLVDTGKTVARAGNQLAQRIIQIWNSYQAFATQTNQKTLAFTKTIIVQAASFVTQSLAFTGQQVGKAFTVFGKTTQTLLAATRQGIGNTTKSIGEGYNHLANNAPGVARTILMGIGNGVSTTTSAIASATNTITTTLTSAIASVSKATSDLVQNIGTTAKTVAKVPIQIAKQLAFGVKNTFAGVTQQTTRKITDTFGPLIGTVSQQTNRLLAKGKLIIIVNNELLFDKEPTKIIAVRVEKVTPTTAVIYWQTNHHATSAVNYGFDTSYGHKVQSGERVKEHRMELTNLEPGRTYFFEVMSQNKNYIYDAYYTFETPTQEKTTERY